MLKIKGRVTHRVINGVIFRNRHVVEYGHFNVTEGLLYSGKDHSFSYQLEKNVSVACSSPRNKNRLVLRKAEV